MYTDAELIPMLKPMHSCFVPAYYRRHKWRRHSAALSRSARVSSARNVCGRGGDVVGLGRAVKRIVCSAIAVNVRASNLGGRQRGEVEQAEDDAHHFDVCACWGGA